MPTRSTPGDVARRPLPPGRPAERERRAAGSGAPTTGSSTGRVAVHVHRAADRRADGLLEAARRSAAAHDRRMLRVPGRRPDATSSATSSTSGARAPRSTSWSPATGPLLPAGPPGWSPRWPPRMARAHDAGLAHGRLVPENVLIDQSGRSGSSASPSTPPCTDCRRAAVAPTSSTWPAVLYAALTGKWAGVSRSPCRRPRWCTARCCARASVRAGIPRPLDTLCDQVINPTSGRTRARPTTCQRDRRGRRAAEFVGDPTGMAAPRRRAGPAHGAHRNPTHPLPPVPTRPGSSRRLRTRPTRLPERPADVAEPGPRSSPSRPSRAYRSSSPPRPGMPDLRRRTTRSAGSPTRAEAPPPPPPFEEPPERAAVRARAAGRAARYADRDPAPRPPGPGLLALGSTSPGTRSRNEHGQRRVPVPDRTSDDRHRRRARPQLVPAGDGASALGVLLLVAAVAPTTSAAGAPAGRGTRRRPPTDRLVPAVRRPHL